ncbi:MAG TPA: Ig-like domain-containing protein [Candidatus Angelobacter sp.]|nr:Ig-like domain-containing protein [Candidatus Angelobacter sp.]
MPLRTILLIAVLLAGLTTGSAQAACTAPVLAMFNICSPFQETSVTNPIQVSASSTPPQGTITSLQLWVDGKKYMNSTTGNLSGALPVTLTSGKHRFTFIMTANSSIGSRSWNTIIYVNVQ